MEPGKFLNSAFNRYFFWIFLYDLVEAGKYEFKFKLVTPEKRMFTVGFHRDETIGILKV